MKSQSNLVNLGLLLCSSASLEQSGLHFQKILLPLCTQVGNLGYGICSPSSWRVVSGPFSKVWGFLSSFVFQILKVTGREGDICVNFSSLLISVFV